MADPIFINAQKMQDKIQEDLLYSDKFKQSKRDQYRADKAISSEVSGYNLQDRQNQYNLQDLNQNFGTNLAESRQNSQYKLLDSTDKVSTFASVKEERDKTRQVSIANLDQQIATTTDRNHAADLQLQKQILQDQQVIDEHAIRSDISEEELKAKYDQSKLINEQFQSYKLKSNQELANDLLNAQQEAELIPIGHQKDIAQAKVDVIKANSDLKNAPINANTAALTADVANKEARYKALTLTSEQELTTLTRENQTADAVQTKVTAKDRHQIEIDDLTLKAQEARAKAQTAGSVVEAIKANAEADAYDASIRQAVNKDAERNRVAAQKIADANRDIAARVARTGLLAQEAASSNVIQDNTEKMQLADIKASMPDFELMPKYDKYSALFTAIDGKPFEDGMRKKLRAEVADKMRPELRLVDAIDNWIILMSSGASKAQRDTAQRKVQSASAGADPRMIMLAIDNGVIEAGTVSDQVIEFLESASSEGGALDVRSTISNAAQSANEKTTAPVSDMQVDIQGNPLPVDEEAKYFTSKGPTLEARLPPEYAGVFSKDMVSSPDAEKVLQNLVNLQEYLRTSPLNAATKQDLMDNIARRSQQAASKVQISN